MEGSEGIEDGSAEGEEREGRVAAGPNDGKRGAEAGLRGGKQRQAGNTGRSRNWRRAQ